MARRVNTKFLTILTCVVLGLAGAGVLAKKFLIRESPEKYVNAGKQALAEKQYEKAVQNFAHAVALDQKNTALWVQYGDALNELSSVDPEYLGRTKHAWESALAIDAGYEPALDRMMQYWTDLANLSASPSDFEHLYTTAKNLHAADPKNAAAEVAIVTSQIRPWLVGVEKDQRIVEEQIAKLQELIKKHPENPDLPLFAAQAKLRLAERRRAQEQNPDSKQAQALVDEAAQIIGDSVARTPTAPMYYSAAQAYNVQEFTDPRNATTWRQKKREMYKKASEVATPDDPLYAGIHINAARAVVGDDPAAAEKILRALYEKMPDDQHVRLALAEHLAGDKAKRAEAVAILERPFANSSLRGPKALMARNLQSVTLVMLTNLRLTQFAEADPEQRKKLIDPIKDGIAKVEARDGVGPRSLHLKGKLLRMQGQTIEAIQTLEKARQLAEQRYAHLEQSGGGLERWEITHLLARAYIETNQMGQAKQLLTGLVNKFPVYDPARMLLTQILIKDGSYDDARPHVEYFQRKDPNNPDVQKWVIQLMDPRNTVKDPSKDAERTKIRDAYAKLPEGTRQEIIDKVNAAMVIDQPEEASRLLTKGQKAFPGDYDVVRMAVRVYRTSGDIDAAKSAVAEGLKANPKDEKLQVLSRQVADLTPENLMKVQEEELLKHPDEFVKNMGLANLARRRNQPDVSLKYLLAARNLRPDDFQVNAMLFNHYLWQRQFEQAEGMLESIARGNMDQAGGLLYRYRLAMAKDEHQSALNYARQLTQRMPEFGQSWLALAQAQQATNQFEEALKNYNEALLKQSDSADAMRGSVECYYALNRPNDARARIRDARRAMPGNQHFLELEINHELTYGDPEKAIAPREDQLKRNPEKMQAVLALGQAYLKTAQSFIARPDKQKEIAPLFAKAREQFRTGLTKWPDEIAFYAYYAETAARSNELGDAEQVLKQLATRDKWKDRTEPQMLLAEYYGITKRYAEAEAALRAIIAREPKNTEYQVRLANMLFNQNKVDDALKALEANTDQPRIARRKVEMLLQTNRMDEAEKALDEVLARTPSNLEMLQLASSVQIARAQYPEAEQKLNRALEIEPENPTTHYFVGLLRMSQPKADVPLAMKHLSKGKDSPSMGIDARFALAECLRRQGNVDDAIRELEAALQSQPTNKRVRLALIKEYLALQPPRTVDAERAINEGKRNPGMADDPDLMQHEVTILSAKNPKQAADLINKVLAANPTDKTVQRTSLELLLKSGNYKDIGPRASEIIQKDADAWWAYQARGVASRYLGRKDEAIKDFEAALDATIRLKDDFASNDVIRTMGDVIGPDEVITRIRPRADQAPKWMIMIARLQQTKGDTQGSIKTLEGVLAREQELTREDKINAYRFGGTLYLLVSDAQKSADCYKKLLELVPDDMTALNNLAVLLAEIVQPPDPKGGLAYSQRAYDLMQKSGRRDPLVLDTHGWLLVLAGQVDQGIDVLRQALQIHRIPDAHYHLGEAYLRKSFADQSLRELELALALYRDMKEQKQPVDPSLEGKIENALTRANIAARSKKSTAGAVP